MHRHKTALPALSLAFLAGTVGLPAAAQQTGTDRIAADLTYLAADARQGRGVGTAGLDVAAEYIAAALARAGLRPGGTEGYFQPFTIDPSAPAAAHTGVGGARV